MTNVKWQETNGYHSVNAQEREQRAAYVRRGFAGRTEREDLKVFSKELGD